MAEMSAALTARDLGANHAVTVVACLGNVLFGQWLRKTRPAAACIELVGGIEQGGTTAKTGIGAWISAIPILACERPLGAFLSGNAILLARQTGAPFGVCHGLLIINAHCFLAGVGVMRIVVLGSGLIGVASAWFLSEAGHEVTVVDRQPGPARETSFANGGQISTSHAEPWANPGTPKKILKWLGREDAPLLWRFSPELARWEWGLRFLRECTAARTRANIQAILALALDSRMRLKSLRQDLGLEYDCLERGILHFYTDEAEFAHAIPQAALMREFGCERVVMTAAECLAIEPALQHAAVPIVGGTYTASDESGDAYRFAVLLADRCAERGVCFRFDTTVESLDVVGGQVRGIVSSSGERMPAEVVVVAMGSYSPRFLSRVGIRIPVYPAKGYSITVPLADHSLAPIVSLTDDGAKLVYSRFGNRLRVAGTAEFSGYDVSMNPVRLQPMIRRVRDIFPRLNFSDDSIDTWSGLRPATPNNVPLIGSTPLRGLFVNTGHGTLGWTLAVGSGQLLADILASRSTAIDPAPYQI